MQRRLAELKEIIDRHDTEAMKAYLDRARANIV
jgi:hypothetical protein